MHIFELHVVWCGVYKIRINIVNPMQWLKLYVDLEEHAIGLDVKLTLFVIPCNIFGRLKIYSVTIIVTNQVIFHPNISHP